MNYTPWPTRDRYEHLPLPILTPPAAQRRWACGGWAVLPWLDTAPCAPGVGGALGPGHFLIRSGGAGLVVCKRPIPGTPTYCYWSTDSTGEMFPLPSHTWHTSVRDSTSAELNTEYWMAEPAPAHELHSATGASNTATERTTIATSNTSISRALFLPISVHYTGHDLEKQADA